MADTTPEKRGERARWWPDLVPRRWLDMMEWPAFESRLAARDIRVEEVVEDGTLVIRAEMPGIDPEKDLDVHVRDHTLEIRAHRTQHETKDEEGMHRSEFHYGSFFRALRLPPEAKESEVEATYKDGIVEVRVPMAETRETETTRIAVKPG